MAVTETDKGIMPGVEGIKTPEATGKTPDADKVSPEDQPKWSDNQLNDFLQQATSEAGRKRTDAQAEVTTLKSQIQTKESEVGDIQAERDSLRTEIEGLTENDPKKFDLVKKDRDLRIRESKLKTDTRTLETDRATVTTGLEKVNAFEAEVLMETVADEYEGGDKARLKTLCDSFGARSEEQIRKVAGTLWGKGATKVAPEAKKPTLTPFSGRTDGGSDSLANLSPKDRVAAADQKLRQ